MLIPVLIMAAVALTAIGASVYVTRKPKATLSLGKASVREGKGEERIVTIPFTLHFKSLNTANKSQYPYIRCVSDRTGAGESGDLPTDQEEVTGVVVVTVTNPDVEGIIRYRCQEPQTQASAEVRVDLRSLATEPTASPIPTETQATESSSGTASLLAQTKWQYMIEIGGGVGGIMTFENVSESSANGSYTEHGPLGVETKRFTATYDGGNNLMINLPDFGQMITTISPDWKSMSGTLKDRPDVSNFFSATRQE